MASIYRVTNPEKHLAYLYPDLRLRQSIVAFRRRHFKHPGKDELKKTVMERVLLDREFGVERPDRPVCIFNS
jgi:hypothetical protein